MKKLEFVKKGENFLEYKQEQLIRQIKGRFSKYKKHQKIFYDYYRKAMLTLNEAYKEMGKRGVNLISNISKIQFKPVIDIKYEKQVGILFPNIKFELKQEEKLPPYSFENTSQYLDELILILKDFFKNLILYAESEDILLKILFNFKKINRRLNGLKNIIIPDYDLNIKLIKGILEEQERENFVRLKKTKNLIKNKI